MGLHLGDTAPDFTAMTTDGELSFHEWKKGSWAVFFSHPADFTPVCTTELGRTAALEGQFAERNTKAMALSIDPIEEHHRWAPDIGEVTGTALNFPIVADPDHRIAVSGARGWGSRSGSPRPTPSAGCRGRGCRRRRAACGPGA
jgi:thioredoxin-dependent peroxiredoxin